MKNPTKKKIKKKGKKKRGERERETKEEREDDVGSSRNNTAFNSGRRRRGGGGGPKQGRERKGGRSQSLDVLEEDVRPRVADEEKRTTTSGERVFENIDIVIIVVVVICNLQSVEEARLHRWGSRNDWVASPRAIGEKIWRR